VFLVENKCFAYEIFLPQICFGNILSDSSIVAPRALQQHQKCVAYIEEGDRVREVLLSHVGYQKHEGYILLGLNR